MLPKCHKGVAATGLKPSWASEQYPSWVTKHCEAAEGACDQHEVQPYAALHGQMAVIMFNAMALHRRWGELLLPLAARELSCQLLPGSTSVLLFNLFPGFNTPRVCIQNPQYAQAAAARHGSHENIAGIHKKMLWWPVMLQSCCNSSVALQHLILAVWLGATPPMCQHNYIFIKALVWEQLTMSP